MSDSPSERFRIEADPDQGVTSRVLDLLSQADRFPRSMRLDRGDRTLTLSLELDAAPFCRVPIVARMRQIPGIRKVASLGLASV